MSIGIIELGGDNIGMGQFHIHMNEAFRKIDVERKTYTSHDRIFDKDFSRINFKRYWTTKHKIFRLLFLIASSICLFTIIISKKHRFYILHYFGESGYNKYLVFLFKILSIKYVVFVHDLDSLKREVPESKKILLEATCLVGLNDGVVVDLKKLFPNLPVLRVQHPRYGEVRAKKKRVQEIRVLFWGHLKKSKGLEILLDAVESMDNEERINYRFSISGRNASYTSQELAEIVKRCKNLNIAINTQFSSEAELEMMLISTDVVVLPYTKVYQSGALLHSIAHQTCIVASDISFFSRELKHGKTGFLFESGNSEKLKQCILSLRSINIGEISAMAYKEYLTKYSVEMLSEDLKKLYYEMQSL